MSEYKVAERIALLNSSERKAFRRKLRDTGNVQQLRLYDKITKLQDAGLPVDKKKAFAKVFEEPWSIDKDYLIRNLFRLLSDDVEEFLLSQNSDFRISILRRLFMLRRMIEIGQFIGFREEFDELYTTAQAANDIETQAELLKIYSEYIIKSNRGLATKQADAAEAFFTEHELILRHSKYKIEELALRYAAAVRRAGDLGIELNLFMPAVAHDTGSDPVISYFRTHASVYRLSGIAQAVKAADALSLLENINTPIIDRLTHAIDLTGLMASGYDDSGEHVAAAAIYEQMPVMPGFENYQQEPEVFDNYTLCLLRIGKYKHTAELIEQRAKSSKPETHLQLRRAMCLVFEERGIEAENSIGELKIEDADNNYLFGQLILLCTKMQRNEIASAQELLKNLMQSRAFRKNASALFKEQIDLFRRSINISLTDKAARQQLSSETDAAFNSKHIAVQLPLIWLKQYLNTAAIIPLRII
ncbi:MAG: hypothetical protein ACRC3B_02180 [Bacteroidia bacterium]